jgi:glycosyltransferase involved in cell wall biosynthesis
LNPHKGHSVLLKAVRLLHGQGCDVRLRLTGGATKDLLAYTPLALPELEEARSVLAGGSAEFHRLVEVLGMVSKEEVEMCFAEADLVVLPSRYEGFGLPLAEAVARGKRVLCSDIPAFREQIRLYGFDRAVTFVVSETAVAWADAIRQALSDYRQAPYSSGELRNLFARWTWSDVAWHYAETLAAA